MNTLSADGLRNISDYTAHIDSVVQQGLNHKINEQMQDDQNIFNTAIILNNVSFCTANYFTFISEIQ